MRQITIAFTLVVLTTGVVRGEQVVVTPEETDEILANPGMGWETFHRTSKQDKNLPSWIPSTVHYARWGWGQLESQPGTLNTEFLDKVLKETHNSGQKLAFRVMCCSTTKGRPYRLVLKELQHPAQVKPGEKLELAMKWQNVGSAPCYKPYRVAYRLTNDSPPVQGVRCPLQGKRNGDTSGSPPFPTWRQLLRLPPP